MSYDRMLREDRRLAILRILEDASGYTMNESVLNNMLDQLGHEVARDVVLGDLAWLKEQGLVDLSLVADKITVARIKLRGQEVARGRVVHPGVKRPSAGG